MYVDMFVKIKLKLNNLKKKKIISSIGFFFPLTFADDLCQRRRIQFSKLFCFIHDTLSHSVECVCTTNYASKVVKKKTRERFCVHTPHHY
jgi:hypothetical protein